MDLQILILYEDEELIVCRKPAGVPVQTRNFMAQDMESYLKNYRSEKGEPPLIWLLHRLDQPVSGIIAFAKTKEAAADIGRQMAVKLVGKYYYAMTDGIVTKKKGTLEDYLLRDGKTNASSVVPKGTKDAKLARLSYQVTEQGKGRSILKIQLETGRHHQIRVQLAHAGYPIVGDKKYNFRENIAPSGQNLALCSYKIGFRHPKTHKKLEFEIDKPFALS